jgi:hypothetical protein
MPWKSGESGSPAHMFKKGHAPISPGRRIGIVRLVRDLTHNGEDCVQLLYQVMTGTLPRLELWALKNQRVIAALKRRRRTEPRKRGKPAPSDLPLPDYEAVTVQERITAARLLIERGFGKVPLTFELAQRPPTPVPLEELDDQELAQVMDLLGRARHRRQARVIEGKAEALPEETIE